MQRCDIHNVGPSLSVFFRFAVINNTVTVAVITLPINSALIVNLTCLTYIHTCVPRYLILSLRRYGRKYLIAIHSRTKVNAYSYYGSAIIGRVNLQVTAGLYYILRYITLSMLYAYSALTADKRADSCRYT